MNRETSLLSIVLPVFNESGILKKSISEILKHVKATGLSYEIIIIDDGSTDKTWETVSSLSGDSEEIKGIKLSRNFGKESAIATGLQFAAGDAVIVMDGDLQHPPELIPRMVRLWLDEKADIVEAVKDDRGDEPFMSSLRAKVFYVIIKYLSGLKLDNSSDFKLLDRKVVDACNQLSERVRFFRGIISWLGFRKVKVPFSVRERAGGRSGWSTGQLIKLAIDASTAFSSIPLHFITVLGIITLALSLIIGTQTLYMKFSGQAVSGFTTVIILLLFIGSVLMLSLGIIGIYISRIFEEVKRRPVFIVEKTENFKPADFK